MKSRWIEHKGKRVFLADFSEFGMDSSALQSECDQIADTLVLEQPASVLSISNVHGTIATPANLSVFKGLLPVTNKYVRVRGVIGVTGARRAFIELVNKLTGGNRFTIFDTLEQGLEWIVEK